MASQIFDVEREFAIAKEFVSQCPGSWLNPNYKDGSLQSFEVLGPADVGFQWVTFRAVYGTGDGHSPE